MSEPRTKAEAEFDITRPLALLRSEWQPHEKCVYIYSTAVDGVNALRVATIRVANVVGISDEQEQALCERIADHFVWEPS